MAVSWISLPSSSASADPAVFTADRTIVAASLIVGSGRVEERAYRDGAFLYPYLRSTKDGLTFRLVRDGGWPAGITQLFVDEEIAPTAVPTSLWSVLYEKDLRTLASGPVRASYYADETIDGQPWWVHVGTSLQIVNGSGIVMTGKQAPSGGNNYAGTYAGLRVSEIAGYDPAKHVAVQFRMSGAPVGGMQYGTRIHSGSGAFGAPATGATTLSCTPQTFKHTLTFWSSNFGLNYARDVVSEASIPDASTWVFAASATPWVVAGSLQHDTQFRSHSFQRQVLGAQFPAMESMQTFGVTNDRGTGENAAYRIGMWVAGPNVSTAATLAMTHVRVLQKAVAAL